VLSKKLSWEAGIMAQHDETELSAKKDNATSKRIRSSKINAFNHHQESVLARL
jgi:hypothetical protein